MTTTISGVARAFRQPRSIAMRAIEQPHYYAEYNIYRRFLDKYLGPRPRVDGTMRLENWFRMIDDTAARLANVERFSAHPRRKRVFPHYSDFPFSELA